MFFQIGFGSGYCFYADAVFGKNIANLVEVDRCMVIFGKNQQVGAVFLFIQGIHAAVKTG